MLTQVLIVAGALTGIGGLIGPGRHPATA